MDNKNYIRDIANRIKAKVDPERLPDSDEVEELFNAYAVLALAKGKSVTNEDVHDAWSAWATKYDPGNSSLVPYSQLSKNIQEEDRRFAVAIREVATSLS